MTKRTTAHRSLQMAAILLVSIFVLPTEVFAWNPLVYNGRCAEKGNRCDSTVGNAGGAGACCDPANPRANGYNSVPDCANRNACSGGAAYKWKAIPLTWYWNPNNRPGGFQRRTEAQFATALQEAVDAWSKPTCTSFKATYGGIRTNLAPSTRDGSVVLYFPTQAEWAQFGAGSSTLAFARPIPTNSQGDLGDGDVIFNPNLSWGADNVQNNEYDITSVASHEFGHAIGLGHSQFSSALMYYATSGIGPLWANTYKRNLPADDVTAICSTYPRLNCTQQSDCSGCFTCNTASKTCEPRQVALVTGLCKPCTKPEDCGGAADICIRTPEGNRCGQACDKDECCPSGYRCSDVGGGQKQCVHTSGTCPPISCTTNTNCGPGESCQNGTCKPQPVTQDANACKICSNGQCAGSNKCFDLRGEDRCLQPCAADLFCPTGFDCQSTSSGRICVPENLICPCGIDADCPTGQVCRNKFCQKPGGGTFGDPCGDQQPCATGFECTPTQGGSLCIQFCGQSASSAPAGSPGSVCTGSGGCSNGATCFQTGSSGNICMVQCTSNTNCTSGNGGQCFQVGNNVNACLCSQDSQCKSGFTCNKATLSKLFQQSVGACAPTSGPVSCFAGSACKDAQAPQTACSAQSQDCICYPTGTKGPGEACSQNELCKDGLQCVGVGTNSYLCMEPCQNGQPGQCKFGGSCVIPAQGGSYFCGCSNAAPCPAGQRCNFAFGTAGYCVAQDPNACGNGTCDGSLGENCATCPKDCACSGGRQCINNLCQDPPKNCGNNACDSGENCQNCPGDCKCPAGQNCDAGVCKAPVQDCGNGTCQTDKGENCATCAADCGCPNGQACQNNACVASQSCGNGTCDNGEHCGSCPADCKCPSGQSCQNNVCAASQDCGNGTCQADKGENCATCAADCGCPSGQACQNNVCVAAQDCGNGTCQADKGEHCGSCPSDCKCPSGQSCQNNACAATKPTLPCPVEEQAEECDVEGKNCATVCVKPKTGCACQSNPQDPFQLPFSLLFVLAFWLYLRRRLA